MDYKQIFTGDDALFFDSRSVRANRNWFNKTNFDSVSYNDLDLDLIKAESIHYWKFVPKLNGTDRSIYFTPKVLQELAAFHSMLESKYGFLEKRASLKDIDDFLEKRKAFIELVGLHRLLVTVASGNPFRLEGPTEFRKGYDALVRLARKYKVKAGGRRYSRPRKKPKRNDLHTEEEIIISAIDCSLKNKPSCRIITREIYLPDLLRTFSDYLIDTGDYPDLAAALVDKPVQIYNVDTRIFEDTRENINLRKELHQLAPEKIKRITLD